MQKAKTGYKLVRWHFGKYKEIPEDWEYKKIDDMIKFEGGSQPSRTNFIFESKEGYVRMIQIRDFKTDHYPTYIPKKSARKFFEEDDVMIGRYGPPNFQILRGLKGAYNVALIKAIPKSGLGKNYLHYFLKQEKLFVLMDSLGQRTAGQDGVELDILKKLPFPLPPKSEREKITSILSNVDNLIDSYNKAIETTKKFKTGLMQQLLTKGIGHTKSKKVKSYFGKFKEIPIDWTRMSLHELGKLTAGGTPSRFNSDYWKNGTIPWISSGEIKNNRIQKINEKITKLGLENSAARLLPKGTILIAITGFGKTRGRTSILEIDASTNQSVIGIICNNHIYNIFLWYQLQNNYQILRNFAQGTQQPGLNLDIVKKFQIFLPKDTNEQRKITGILSASDSKLDDLESKKSYLELLKKGLMQKLLTGQIRVKI